MTKNSEIEPLAPCPHCNGKAVNSANNYETPSGRGYIVRHFVECMECESRTKEYDTEREATKSWNTRQERSGLRVEFPEKRGHHENCDYFEGANEFCDCGAKEYNACIDEMKKLNSSSSSQRSGLDEKKVCNQDYWLEEGIRRGTEIGMQKMYDQLKEQGLLSPQGLKPLSSKAFMDNAPPWREKWRLGEIEEFCAKFAVPNEGLSEEELVELLEKWGVHNTLGFRYKLSRALKSALENKR